MEFPINLSMFLIIAIILAMFFLIYRGYKNGLIVEVIKTLTVILSVIGAWIISGILNSSISLIKETSLETGVELADQQVVGLANRGVLFLIFFVVCFIGLWILRHFLKKLNELSFVGSFNQILGSVFGFLKGCLYTIILVIAFASPIINNGKEVLERSGLMPLKELIQTHVPIAHDVLDGFDTLDDVLNSNIE